MVKTVRSTLKKALKGNSNAKIDIIAAEWGLNKKIEAIRNLISQDNDFSVEYINIYKDFIMLFKDYHGKVDFLGVVISAVPFSKFPRSLGKSLE
jgi:hypothetical protein